MPRTLFTSTAARREAHSPGARYTWLTGLQVLPVGDSHVMVNPAHGGWVAFSADEYRALGLNPQPPQGELGEFLYQSGICGRDGHSIEFDRHSDFTEQLYFFEFAVTTGCNLACRYCFADAQSAVHGQRATTELAQLFVDRIAEFRAATRSQLPFVIEFTGGEPLLNFKVIRHCIDYARQTYGDALNVQFVIQSNITLLTDEILAYVQEQKVGLGFSCDGFGRIHDRQRPYASGTGSHKRVEANMAKLVDQYPDNTGSPIVVVTDEGVDKIPELALYFYLKGFRDIILRPMAPIGRGAVVDHADRFAGTYVNRLFHTLSDVITPLYHQTGELLQERYLSLTFQHLIQPYRAFMCERSPCGGARNICIVTPDGDVFPCNQSTDGEQFRLGNIRTSGFVDLLKSPAAQMFGARTTEQIPECRGCAYKAWCSSPCPVAAFWQTGTVMAKSPDCELFRGRYRRALEGLLGDEFDLSVVGAMVGFDGPVRWLTG